MLKTLTAIALVLGLATAAYAHEDVSNESFILQANTSSHSPGNLALVGQENGHNKQATLQFGSENIAITGQDSGRDPGRNSALTLQAGNENFALTLQRNSHDLKNTSAVLQFGNRNAAIVAQH